MPHPEDDGIRALLDALGQVPEDVVVRGDRTTETVGHLGAMT